MQFLLDVATFVLVGPLAVALLYGVADGFGIAILLLPILALPLGSACAAAALWAGEAVARRGPGPAFATALVGWAAAAALLGVVAAEQTDLSAPVVAGALLLSRVGSLWLLPTALHELAVAGLDLDPTPYCAIDDAEREPGPSSE